MGLPKDEPLAAIEPLDEWYSRTPIPSDFSRTAAIFHVSRCGSTLLTQNLKATGKALVLSEPPFMRVLRTLLDDSLDMATAVGVVARIIGAWQAEAERRGCQLVIKFNSQAHLYQHDLMQALPGARFLFLHRDPVAVLESIDRGPPPYLKREFTQHDFDLLPDLEETETPTVLKAAASRYCGALRAFSAAENPDLAFVAYPDLARQWPAILGHFGIEGAATSWDATSNAKAADPAKARPYRGVAEARLSQFAASYPQLVAIAQQHYTQFLAACGRDHHTMAGERH